MRPADEPVPQGPAARRDRHPVGVLLPPRPHLDDRLREGRRHADATPPTGGGPYDSTYYADAIGKTGTALRSSLHTIIKSQTKLTYDQVWDALKDTDQDPNNAGNVIELYSGRSISKTLNGGGVGRLEPRARLGQEPRRLRHRRPVRAPTCTTCARRTSRSTPPAATRTSTTAAPRSASAPDCWSDADSFEPRDAVKGDVARMILYMAVRYEGDDGLADLEPNESVGNGTAPYIGKLSVLLAWNAAGPAGRVREAPQRRHLRPSGSTTGTRSSTTRSGPPRSSAEPPARRRPIPGDGAALLCPYDYCHLTHSY